jgi:hypothetical protein
MESFEVLLGGFSRDHMTSKLPPAIILSVQTPKSIQNLGPGHRRYLKHHVSLSLSHTQSFEVLLGGFSRDYMTSKLLPAIILSVRTPKSIQNIFIRDIDI